MAMPSQISGWFDAHNGWPFLHDQAGQALRGAGPMPMSKKLIIHDVAPTFELDVVVPFFLTGANSVRRMHAINRVVRPPPRRIYALGTTSHCANLLPEVLTQFAISIVSRSRR